MAQGITDARLVRTGYGCNNACRFCCQAALRATEPGKDPGDVLQEIGAVSAGETVVLSGGEATLRRELSEWVQAAKGAGASKVIVQTNGRMLSYRKLAKRLVQSGVDVFAVALHGHKAELHDWLTRTEGSFDQALVGIRNVQSCGGVVYVNTVITRSNFRHLPDMAKMLPSWGALGIRFVWPRPEGDAVAEAPALIPHPEMVEPYLTQAMGIAGALNRHASVEMPETDKPAEARHVVATG